MLSLRSPESHWLRRSAVLAIPLSLMLAACGSNNDGRSITPAAEITTGDQTGEVDVKQVYLNNGNMVIEYVNDNADKYTDILFSCLANGDVVFQSRAIGYDSGRAGNGPGYITDFVPCADGVLTPSDYAGK